MLIVEDGTGKTDGNSFLTVAEATEFLTARGLTAFADLPSEAAREAALINASEFVSGAFGWIGVRQTLPQALAWPRGPGSGFWRVPTGVPAQVKKAVARVADVLAQGNSLFAPVDGTSLVKSTAAGSVRVDFADQGIAIAATGRASMPWLGELLNGLITYAPDDPATNGFGTLYVARA